MLGNVPYKIPTSSKYTYNLLVRPFLCVNSRVLLEIAQRGEKLGTNLQCKISLLRRKERKKVFKNTNLTIKRFPVVQPLVGPQPVARVERLPARTVRTDEWLDFGVNTDVDLLAVRGEEGLAATILGALELVLTWNVFKICFNYSTN